MKYIFLLIRNGIFMKRLYQIAIVSLLVCSFVFARITGNKSLPSWVESKISSNSSKKEFVPGTGENDNSIKWKRRHKRRRRAKNRRPQRGR
jgi:hypothetical protein